MVVFARVHRLAFCVALCPIIRASSSLPCYNRVTFRPLRAVLEPARGALREVPVWSPFRRVPGRGRTGRGARAALRCGRTWSCRSSTFLLAVSCRAAPTGIMGLLKVNAPAPPLVSTMIIAGTPAVVIPVLSIARPEIKPPGESAPKTDCVLGPALKLKLTLSSVTNVLPSVVQSLPTAGSTATPPTPVAVTGVVSGVAMELARPVG